MNNNYPPCADGKKDYESFVLDVSKSSAGAGGTVFLPDLAGSHFPNVDPYSRGAYLGVSENTRKEDFSRAVLEGLTYMASGVIYECETIIGRCLNDVTVTGGGTRNQEWMRIKADVLGRRINVSKMAEDSARGAAMLAGIGCGLFSGYEDAISRTDICSESVEPCMENHETYKKYMGVYTEVYPTLKNLNQRIVALVGGS